VTHGLSLSNSTRFFGFGICSYVRPPRFSAVIEICNLGQSPRFFAAHIWPFPSQSSNVQFVFLFVSANGESGQHDCSHCRWGELCHTLGKFWPLICRDAARVFHCWLSYWCSRHYFHSVFRFVVSLSRNTTARLCWVYGPRCRLLTNFL